MGRFPALNLWDTNLEFFGSFTNRNSKRPTLNPDSICWGCMLEYRGESKAERGSLTGSPVKVEQKFLFGCGGMVKPSRCLDPSV